MFSKPEKSKAVVRRRSFVQARGVARLIEEESLELTEAKARRGTIDIDIVTRSRRVPSREEETREGPGDRRAIRQSEAR